MNKKISRPAVVFVCIMGSIVILVCSVIYFQVMFPVDVVVKREAGALLRNGLSLVKVSSNVDLVKLKEDSSNYNCWVYSSGDEPDHEGCSLYRASFFDGENMAWDVSNGQISPEKLYFVIQYKSKKLDNNGKVGLELWFVPRLISNPISVYIDG